MSDRRSAPHARPARGPSRPRLFVAIGGISAIVLATMAVATLGHPGATGSGPIAGASSVGGALSPAEPSAESAGGAQPPTSPGVTATVTPSVPIVPIVAVPIVPVADFRSTVTAVTMGDVEAVLGGTSHRWSTLEFVADESAPILAALGVRVGGQRFVPVSSPAGLMADLAAHRDRLGFLRADEVGPGIRALGWGPAQLFGVHRLKDAGAWPLMARLSADTGSPYDPATTWTLFAAGDLGLDRAYADVVKNQGKGMDYPFDGGTARITGVVCCSPFGWKVPTIVSTGHQGAMRDLISSADLALANMEESAPTRFSFHPHGTVFTGDPALVAGIARAGIDVASVASTHIGDGGRAGILQTMASLTKNGIVPFGAGPNLVAARQPAIVEMGGVKVAILGYDGISSKYYGASATTIGDAPLKAAFIEADVAAARASGAQVVIVFPHWGIEYTFGPSPSQQRLGRLMIDAGADMVIGNHPHWVQSVEIYKGKPIWYSLGNFTFDQSWSEPTLEGVTLELTFSNRTLVQAWMNPHILIRAVQPNLLDIAGDGQRVLKPVFTASGKLLPW